MVTGFTIEHEGTRFVWHGGEYVDIYRVGAEHPFDVINVWDHVAGVARIPFSVDGLESVACEYLGVSECLLGFAIVSL